MSESYTSLMIFIPNIFKQRLLLDEEDRSGVSIIQSKENESSVIRFIFHAKMSNVLPLAPEM